MQEKLFDRLEGFFPSFLFVKDASGNMMPMMHLTFHNNQGFFCLIEKTWRRGEDFHHGSVLAHYDDQESHFFPSI